MVTTTDTVTFQQLSARWSRVLGAASASTLGTAIEMSLEDLGRFADVDVAFVTLVDDHELVADDWQWVREGKQASAPAVGTKLQDTFASIVEFLRLGHHIATEDIADIELSPTERALADANRLRALLVVPVRIGEALVGVAGLMVLDEPRSWDKRLVDQLTVLAELLVRAVIRTRDRGAALLADVRARRISALVPDGLLLLDPAGAMAWMSPSLVRLTGGEPGDLLGRPFLDLLHPDGREAVGEAVAGAGDQPTVLQAQLRCRGTWRWSTITVQLASDPGSGVPDEVVVSVHDDHDQQVRARQLAVAAERDPLTGAMNRAGLTRRLSHLADGDSQVLVAYCDIDGFKDVNDTGGHERGDAVLQRVAAALQGAVRPDDAVARLGGDEFVVVVSESGSVAEQEAFADRLLAAVAGAGDAGDPPVSASIGIAGPGPAVSAADLLRAADEAMYVAKRSGKARWHRSTLPGSS